MDYKELPEDFLQKMNGLLGSSYSDYIASLSNPPHFGIRINETKEISDSLAERLPWLLEPIPWIKNGFYYESGEKPSRHPYYYAGLYYLQEPSAMTPANLLPITPGDCVLDLCAAPGGKSTELAAKLNGKGMLLSNDISNSRAKALLKNLELFGMEPILVSSETPEKLSGHFTGFFDKILVDAPCSGEGMFRRDPAMVKSYREKGPSYYAAIQKNIMEHAVQMLKPDGLLLYSTCTFDLEENEGTIDYILNTFPEMELVDLEKKENFHPGIGLTECVRLYPHKIKGEGHFIALMHKKEEKVSERERRLSNHMEQTKDRIPESLNVFLKLVNKTFDEQRLYIKNNMIYYLPEPLLKDSRKYLEGLRYLRTGLLLGEFKKDRFEPSQAFAMSLKKNEFANVIDFSSEDERVIRYLKGETIRFTEHEEHEKSGWHLVCTDGFPLGWAKKNNDSLKNKYYPGWRWT